MIRFCVGSIGCLCIVANPGVGQSPATTRQPARAMESLAKALVGTWSTTYAFTPPAPTAADSTGHGEEVWEKGPGGFTLLEKERISTASGDRFILAVQWWDESTHSLRGMVCNNSGAEACDVKSYDNATLTWDGNRLVVDFRFLAGTKPMVWHEVWSDITPTSFLQTGDVGEAGGALKRAMTIHATRSSTPPRGAPHTP